MTLLSEIYDVTLKRDIRGANKSGWIRPTLGEFRMTHKDFQQIQACPADITVGPGKDYATINEAIDVANDGDLIYVYYDTYNESIYRPATKIVNIHGVPESITGNMPSITTDSTEATTGLTTPEAFNGLIYIEGMHIIPRNYTNAGGCWLAASSIGTGSIVFNKCNIDAEGTSAFPVGKGRECAIKYKIVNCHIGKGIRHIHCLMFGDELEKCTFNGGSLTYYDHYRPSLIDAVSNDVSTPEGYGFNYGEFFF